MNKKQRTEVKAWTVVLIALLALLLVVVATDVNAQTCSATLTWEAPTENTDGSPLEDLAGFRVYWGMSSGDYTSSATINDPAASSYIVDSLAAATWYFAATAFNADGLESSFSNEASKTTTGCQALPDPRPPAGVDITVSVVVAYQYLPQDERAVMLPVGELPADTPCDAAEAIVAAGDVYFAVPVSSVSWYGNVEPPVVYARCD